MRSRALVALTLVKLCKGGRCSYLRTPGCAAEPRAKLSLSGLRKFSAACMDPKAFIDDAPMGEEAFVFGGFRLLPAQRLLLEDEKPVHLGSRKLDVLFALVQNAGDTLHKDQRFFRQLQGR